MLELKFGYIYQRIKLYDSKGGHTSKNPLNKRVIHLITETKARLNIYDDKGRWGQSSLITNTTNLACGKSFHKFHELQFLKTKDIIKTNTIHTDFFQYTWCISCKRILIKMYAVLADLLAENV